MRRVVAYELLLLDGVAERPDEFFTDFDDAMRENLRRVIATEDTVVLGRRTYDEWAAFWPASDIQPFADFINGVEKYVVTSTPPAESWANSTVVDGGLVEFVTAQRERSGGDIGVHGSIALASRCWRRDSWTNCGWSSPRCCTCADAGSSTGGRPGG